MGDPWETNERPIDAHGRPPMPTGAYEVHMDTHLRPQETHGRTITVAGRVAWFWLNLLPPQDFAFQYPAIPFLSFLRFPTRQSLIRDFRLPTRSNR